MSKELTQSQRDELVDNVADALSEDFRDIVNDVCETGSIDSTAMLRLETEIKRIRDDYALDYMEADDDPGYTPGELRGF